MKYTGIVFLLLIVSNKAIQAHQLPWYLKKIKKTPLSYKSKCKLITFIQAIKTTSFITKNILTHQTCQKIKEEITQRRLNIQNAYLTKEKIAIDLLGKTLNFPEEIWLQCLQTVDKIKKIVREQSACNNIIHDKALPQRQTLLIKKLLHNNNMNSDNINLIYKPTENKEIFAASSSFIGYTYTPEKIEFIQNPYVTQNIILYEHTFNESESNQIAIYAHEIEHLCQLHGITLGVIEQYTQHHYNKGNNSLKNNKEWLHLKVIYEEQAEIFSALKNPEVAQAFVNLRSKKYYPNHLYETHYHDLVEINNLWKIEKLLNKLLKEAL